MKRFDFTLDGIPVSVYPMRDESGTPSYRESEVAVAFCPCEMCDFAARCFDCVYARDPHVSLAAIAYFFKKVRRLPDATIEVLYLGKTYEVDIERYAIEFTVNSGKCKILYTKTAHFTDGIELKACAVKGREECAVTVVSDVDSFDGSRLLLLSGLLDLPATSPSIAVSFDGTLRVRASRPMAYYDAIAYAVCSLSAVGVRLPEGRLYAELSGRRHAFSVSRGAISFYPDIKYLS